MGGKGGRGGMLLVDRHRFEWLEEKIDFFGC